MQANLSYLQYIPYRSTDNFNIRLTKSSANSQAFLPVPKSSSWENILPILYAEKIKSELQDEFKTWCRELNEEEKTVISSNNINEADKQKARTEVERRCANFNSSSIIMKKFVEFYKEKIREDFIPAVSIDGDGEVAFEWYGRNGARAILTFGENGILYFVALFHGEIFKSQLFLRNGNIPQEIEFYLEKIYRDKKI